MDAALLALWAMKWRTDGRRPSLAISTSGAAASLVHGSAPTSRPQTAMLVGAIGLDAVNIAEGGVPGDAEDCEVAARSCLAASLTLAGTFGG